MSEIDEFATATKDEFDAFIDAYPNEIKISVNGMCFPEIIMFYDFSIAEGWDAVVAKKRPIYEGPGYGVATGKFDYWIIKPTNGDSEK